MFAPCSSEVLSVKLMEFLVDQKEMGTACDCLPCCVVLVLLKTSLKGKVVKNTKQCSRLHFQN